MPNWKTYESSVRLLSAIVAAHPNLKLNYEDISTRFGGDCTKSAIENRFRRIKSDAKIINDAVANGVDPITLPIGDTDGGVAVKGGGRAVADKYGEGVTENAGTPKKPRATPKKAKKNSVAANGGGEEGASDDDMDFSPSKKMSLNKVKVGRVIKSGRGKGNNGANSAANSFNNGDYMIKSENGNSFNADSFDGHENSQDIGSWLNHGEEDSAAAQQYFETQDHNGFEHENNDFEI